MILIQLDPKKLKSHEHHLRTGKDDLKELTESIRQVGVIEPIVVIANGTDEHHILAGHRRAAAAVLAGLDTVPCVTLDHLMGTDDVYITKAMLAENVQRKDLTIIEESSGYARLFALGVPVGEIVQATGRKAKDIATAADIVAHPKTAAITAEHDLTLDEAAMLAEFEDDSEVLKKLTVVAVDQPRNLPGAVERARQERNAREAVETLKAELTAKGERILAEAPYGDARARVLRDLSDANGGAITPAKHRKCPGHAVEIKPPYWGDKKARAIYWCTAAKASGHVFKYGGATDSPRSTGPAAVAQAERDREEKAERRRAQAEFRAATKVRQEFIVKIGKNTLPRAAGVEVWKFVASRLAEGGGFALNAKSQAALFADLIGVDAPISAYDWRVPEEYVAKQSALHNGQELPSAVFLLAAAAIEPNLFYATATSIGARWFQLLKVLGYELADCEVEQLGAKS